MKQNNMSFLKIVVCAICMFSLLYVGTRVVFAAGSDDFIKLYTESMSRRGVGQWYPLPGNPAQNNIPSRFYPVHPAPPAQPASAIVEQACVFIVTDKGSGSGFFVAPGYVVTNAHVVAGANGIFVTSQAMQRPAYAQVVAASSDGVRDYAVLRLASSYGGIRPLVFAAEPRRTERVGAWGFPGLINETDPNYYRFMQGDFSATPVVSYTEGVVSALVGRNPILIVHTAPISPGNSGGPLVNANGDVVGINTAAKLADRSYHQASIAISSSDLLFFLGNNGIPAYYR